MSRYIKNTWVDPNVGNDLLGGLGLCALVACIINSAIPLLEMTVLGGRVPAPPSTIKILCAACLIGLMLLYRTVDLSSFPTTPWIIAMSYLVLVFPYLWFGLNKEPLDILLAYNSYYCPLILLPVGTALKGRVKHQTAATILLVVFAANAILGWAQFWTGDTIIRIESADGAYSIPLNIFQVGGHAYLRLRAFGLFNNSMELGYFGVIIATFGIGMCAHPNNRVKGILMYLFGAATVYSTLTRAVFLQLAIATISAIMLTFGQRANRAKLMPFIGFAVGGFLAAGGLSSVLLGNNQGLASDASLQVRLDQWSYYVEVFRRAPIWQQLFGFGICQADNKVVRSLAVIDNLFLGLTLHIGLVGMVIMLALLWAMWLRIRAEAITNPTPLMIGLASFWSTFALSGVFENAPAIFGFWYLVGILVSARTSGVIPKKFQWAESFALRGSRPVSGIAAQS